MAVVSFTFTDSAVEQLDEIQAALGKADGEVPSKSRVVRMALASLRKRLSDEGLIVEPGK